MTLAAPSRTMRVAPSLLLALLFMAVCLPTGSIFGLNVKIIAFGAFAAAFLLYLVLHSVNWLTPGELVFLCLFGASLCFWSLVALLNGQSEVTDVLHQLRDIASTVVIAWLCISFVRRGHLRAESVITTVVYAIAVLSLLKLALVAATFGWHIDPIEVLESVFGEGAIVGGSIAFSLTRVEFSSDIIGSLALFAILCPSVSGVRFRRVSIVFLVSVLLTSGLLAYARYIWFLEIFAVVAAMIIERRIKLLVTLILAATPITYVSYELLQPLLEARLFSDATIDSDRTRLEQSRALIEEIKARPVFGKGLGTHVSRLIRSEQNRYSYELQWLSLFMQLGVVGIMGILFLVGAAARDLLASRHPAKIWLVLFFTFWLLSGWTNPHLTSSFAGAAFGVFMAMFYRMRTQFLPPLEKSL